MSYKWSKAVLEAGKKTAQRGRHMEAFDSGVAAAGQAARDFKTDTEAFKKLPER